MKKVLVLCAMFIMVFSASAFAGPVVDGFLGGNEYSNSFQAGWYNGHKQEDSQFKKADNHMTTVHWESTGGFFYLGLGAPLEAKNMIWGNGFTDAEAALYYQQFKTHHKETLDEFTSKKTDFGTMTGSEKVIFGQGPLKIDKKGSEVFDKKDFKGVIADLAGDVKIGNGYLGLNLIECKDSVDYVIDILGYDDKNSAAANIPMIFEFKFPGLTGDQIKKLIDDIQTNELEIHLSPERGGPASVPEPATILLIGTGLVGIGVFGRKKLKK